MIRNRTAGRIAQVVQKYLDESEADRLAEGWCAGGVD